VRLLAHPAFASWFMVAALAVMLGAPDHWDLSWPGNDGHVHHHDVDAHRDAHARHCHGDAATCTDFPLTGIGGLAALGNWLSLPPQFVHVPLASRSGVAPEPRGDVATPPPRPMA
jgi:hypothetical protein